MYTNTSPVQSPIYDTVKRLPCTVVVVVVVVVIVVQQQQQQRWQRLIQSISNYCDRSLLIQSCKQVSCKIVQTESVPTSPLDANRSSSYCSSTNRIRSNEESTHTVYKDAIEEYSYCIRRRDGGKRSASRGTCNQYSTEASICSISYCSSTNRIR